VVFDPNGDWYVPLATEVYAPGMAGLLLVGGTIFTVVIGVWEMREGRRRERLDRRHRVRRAREVADQPEA